MRIEPYETLPNTTQTQTTAIEKPLGSFTTLIPKYFLIKMKSPSRCISGVVFVFCLFVWVFFGGAIKSKQLKQNKKFQTSDSHSFTVIQIQ